MKDKLLRLFVIKGLMVFSCVFIFVRIVLAEKAPPFPVKLTQNDGRVFEAQFYGDEFFHWAETLTGYPIVFNKTANNWEYAKRVGNQIEGMSIKADIQIPPDKIVKFNVRELIPTEIIARKRELLLNNASLLKAAAGGQLPTKALVILADFRPGVQLPHVFSRNDFQRLLFSTNEYPTGSMKDYFVEVSNGNYQLGGTVIEWVTAPSSYEYYVDGQSGLGNWPRASEKLVWDLVQIIDPYVNFRDFDGNNDGIVDAVLVVYEGDKGGDQLFWPHRFMLGQNQLTLDGVMVNDYAIVNEQSSGVIQGIGTFCHEWGHVLGLPDLYDTSYRTEGIGEWGLMGSGNWNTQESPAHFCAWSKLQLGWIEERLLDLNAGRINLEKINTAHIAYKLAVPSRLTEYFLLEYRYAMGFDRHLRNNGMLLWHIDELRHTNDKKVYLVQADGENDLENNRNRGDAGDPYPGYGGISNPNRAFSANSVPNNFSNDGFASGVNIAAIGDPSSTLSMLIGEEIDDQSETHFQYQITGKPYSIVITNASVDGVEIQEGDEIAVFDGETVAGAGIFDGVFNFQFPAWEKDALNNLTGFTVGNQMSFRIWNRTIACILFPT